ncbi:MAG: pitrilysin family protein [Acidobacteriota bacterium]|nr:pitrilysin family protein [Acidobacteriota bacterium]
MTSSTLGEIEVEELPNGATVGLVRCPQAPIVSTVVWYRVGTAAEGPEEGGVAHFLEHMMFKGSAAYGPGDVDRITQALGGANNAFTSHDSTAYYFQFAADCWTRALDIEADRMGGLILGSDEVDHERGVVLEEISMYESDPWDALERRVQERVYGTHPYGRPVLGTEASLRAIGSSELRSFHDRHYCPSRATIVVAGDLGVDAAERVRDAFSDLPRGDEWNRPTGRRPTPAADRRITRQHGDVARLLWAVPCPAWHDPDHASLRLTVQALTEGKSSRLHRALVEEEQLCAWVAGELSANLDPGTLSIAAELVPGASPQAVEARLYEIVAAVGTAGFADEEVERARRTFEADWVFGHERIQQRALSVAAALAHGDLAFLFRYRDAVVATDGRQLSLMAAEYLNPARGVVGWSLPEGVRA